MRHFKPNSLQDEIFLLLLYITSNYRCIALVFNEWIVISRMRILFFNGPLIALFVSLHLGFFFFLRFPGSFWTDAFRGRRCRSNQRRIFDLNLIYDMVKNTENNSRHAQKGKIWKRPWSCSLTYSTIWITIDLHFCMHLTQVYHKNHRK